MTKSLWQQTFAGPTHRCDVAIVGGGLLGSAVAYWLSRRRPAPEVALLEAEHVGHGASGRNAGFLLQGAASDYALDRARYGPERARRLWRFTRESRELVERELYGDAFAFVPSGSLVAAGSEDEDERLRKAAAWLREDDLAEADYLDAPAVRERLGSEGFGGALAVPTGAVVDPYRLVRHVAARSGARLLEQCAVRGLEAARGVCILDTVRGRVEAGRVVLCAGAHAGLLVPALSGFVRPVRAQMMATEPMPRRYLDAPVYSHDGYFYVRQAPGGHVLVGGARHRHRRDEVGYEDGTTPAVQEDLKAYLHDYFPWGRGLGVRHRWSGTMGFSPDHLPVVGELPGCPGSWWVGGCTGHGMSYGFGLGRLVADCLEGLPPEAFDLFAAERFDRA